MILRNKQRKLLGAFLADARRVKGFSQKEMATKFKYESAQYISNIERGTCAIPVNLLKLFIKIYELDKRNFISLLQGLYAETIKESLR